MPWTAVTPCFPHAMQRLHYALCLPRSRATGHPRPPTNAQRAPRIRRRWLLSEQYWTDPLFAFTQYRVKAISAYAAEGIFHLPD